MSPLATTLLCAIRYAHGRSLHPYEDVVCAVREVWHLLDPHSQRYLLDLVDDQVPADLARMIETTRQGWSSVSAGELEQERDAYLELINWCRARMGEP